MARRRDERDLHEPVPGQRTVLDWRRDHFSYARGKCRHCQRWTQLRDDAGLPAHKVCAEKAIDEAAQRLGRRS